MGDDRSFIEGDRSFLGDSWVILGKFMGDDRSFMVIHGR